MTWRHVRPRCGAGPSGAPLDGRFLFLPNVAADITYNDDVEEIRFFRDEDANLVWAVEARYTLADGGVVVNGDVPASEPPAEAPARCVAALPVRHDRFPITGFLICRGIIADNPDSTARSICVAAGRVKARHPANPQHKSRVVVGIGAPERGGDPAIRDPRVRRIARYARGSDGKQHFWVGRIKETAPRPTSPDLRFDFLDDK